MIPQNLSSDKLETIAKSTFKTGDSGKLALEKILNTRYINYINYRSLKNWLCQVGIDTEYSYSFDENGQPIREYLTFQAKEKTQDHTAIFLHYHQKNKDDLPNLSSLNDDYLNQLYSAGLISHKVVSSDKPPIFEYLKLISGAKDIKLVERKGPREKRQNKNILPTFTLELFAHFAIVDFLGLLACEGNNIVAETVLKNLKNGNIEYRKHLTTTHIYTESDQDNTETDKITDILAIPSTDIIFVGPDGNEYKYHINLKITDSIAKIGHSSYKNIAKIANHSLPYKDLIPTEAKENIREYFKVNPENFILYSLGDCETPFIVDNLNDIFKRNMELLGLAKYACNMKGTIGASMKQVFLAFLSSETGLSIKQLQDDYLKFRASNVKSFGKDTSFLLSIIAGGRAYPNNSLASVIFGIIIDIDFDGAYNSILNADTLIFPICKGLPFIESIKIDDPKEVITRNNFKKHINKCDTLRQWLDDKNYFDPDKSFLVENLFQLIVTSKTDNMKICQDLIASRYNGQIVFNDDKTMKELKEKSWEIKYLSNEIFNGILTSNSLELILNDIPEVRNYFLDNLVVVTSAYYRKCDQVYDINQVDGFKWYAVKINKLSSKIQSLRKVFPKGTSLNSFFKLNANTIFGILASPLFEVSNPIVANVITDSIRVACWILEKNCNGFRSITDGCQIDANNIFTSKGDRKSINIRNTVGLNNKTGREISNRNLRKRSLIEGSDLEIIIDGYTITDTETDEKLYDNISKETLENLTILNNWKVTPNYLLHDKNSKVTYSRKQLNQIIFDATFKNYSYLPIMKNTRLAGAVSTEGIKENFLLNYNGSDYYLAPYEVEGLIAIDYKELYSAIALQGSANYDLVTLLGKHNIAFRSYRKNGYKGIDIDLNKWDIIAPSESFMKHLLENPKKIPPCKPFFKRQILLPNEWKRNYEKYNVMGIELGTDLGQVGILREFSLSNFIFKNYAQYKAVKSSVTSLIRKYDQSLEMFYRDSEGNLNYDKMIREIGNLIELGLDNIVQILDRKYKLSEDKKYHPYHKELREIKVKLAGKWIEHLAKKKQQAKINKEISESWDFESYLQSQDETNFDTEAGEGDNDIELTSINFDDFDSDNFDFDYN